MFLCSNHIPTFSAAKFRLADLIFSALILCICSASVTAEVPDHNAIRNILVNNTSITYELLRTYFDLITGINSETIVRPRLFPLCIQTSTLEAYSPLLNFVPIWKKLDHQVGCEGRPLYFHEYKASLHSMLHNKDWIDSITFSRINTPEVDVRNMRQWMHITVKAKQPLRALYMQTVVGSMGLSSGEFSLEFPCSDLPGGDTSALDSMIFNCDYRSRAELNHPVAFFGGYAGTKQFTEFHVHYKWTDISCLETPFLQFILIAIKDFKAGSVPEIGIDFQPLFSPVYSNVDFDSQDGVITPYYIDWKDEMTCFKSRQDSSWKLSTKLYHDTHFEPLKWTETKIERLFANEDYEECTTSNSVTSERDENRKECGPGPFKCPEDLSLKTMSDQLGFKKNTQRRQKEFDEAVQMSECSPCIFPKQEDVLHPNCKSFMRSMQSQSRNNAGNSPPGMPQRPLDAHLHLDYSEYFGSSGDAKIHGAFAILAYFVISPVGILIARFYRGNPVHHIQKDDFWVLVHASIHLVTLHLLYISIGFVPTMDEGMTHSSADCYKRAEEIKDDSNSMLTWTQDKYVEWLDECTYKTRKNSHAALGTFSFVLHNVNVILSFFRSRTDYIRNIQVIVHSHLGYIDGIVSVITVGLAVEGQYCTEVFGYCICMLIFTIIAFSCTAWVSSIEDTRLGIDPPRYKWPILEPMRLAHPGPFYEGKLAILGVSAGMLVFVWVLSLIAIGRQQASEITLWSTTVSNADDIRLTGGIFKTCRVPDFFIPKL